MMLPLFIYYERHISYHTISISMYVCMYICTVEHTVYASVYIKRT